MIVEDEGFIDDPVNEIVSVIFNVYLYFFFVEYK